jgi:hypothetical protein
MMHIKLFGGCVEINSVIHIRRGTLLCSWLRHFATSRKVAGSNPDETIGVFNLPNPSSSTTTLGSTPPLTDMSIKNLPGDEGRPARKAANLTANCEPIV